MKKIIVLVATVAIISVSAKAQTKGDFFLGASAAVSGQVIKNSVDGSISYINTDYSTLQLAAGVELGYYLSDKVSLSLLASIPYVYDGGRDGYGINLSPRVTTYFGIASNIYYSPSVAVAWETGSISSSNYTGYGAGVELLALTLKFNDRFSLYMSLAPLSYTHTKVESTKTNCFSYNLGSGSVGVRFNL